MDSDSLRALEALMSEFFDGRTMNSRIREIEELLNNFSKEKDAWRHCLHFLSATSNEYVMMFCMTVLDNLINKQWVVMVGMDRLEIRSTLYKLLLNHHKDFPNFVRNKLVKLIVDIGRLDWPHFYPDFFPNIIQLVQQPETVNLGLVMLLTTSEELICPREDLCVARKDELYRLLLQQVPVILGLLMGILESVLEKRRHLVTATPPPSPTHGQSDLSRSPFSSSPLHTGTLLCSVFKSLSNKNPFYSQPSLDAESHYTCTLALNCLSHLFGWIPLSTHITPNVLNVIFQYASFGCFGNTASHCESHHEGCGSSSTCSLSGPPTLQNDRAACFGLATQGNAEQQNPSLAILAMECVNEIIAKNFLPADFEDFLLHVFQNAFYLLQRMVKDGMTIHSSVIIPIGSNLFENIDESYIEKFTEFLRLFVSIHLRRFVGNSQFPVLEFLTLLYKYTFQQSTHESFIACLDVWSIFLDFLAHNGKLMSNIEEGAVRERYESILLLFVSELQHKVQFSYNQAELEELDDETFDDDHETEWQNFLRQNLDVIAKVAEILPGETCRILYLPFEESLDAYLGLEQYIVPDDVHGRRLNVTAENECPRLHCLLRDLSTLLQAFGTLSSRFTGDAFIPWYDRTRDIVDRVCHCATYGSRVCLFNVVTAVPTVLRLDFIEVHAQTLVTLKAFVHWISQLFGEASKQGEDRERVHELVSVIVSASLPMINKEIPEKIVLSAAQLLSSLTFTVRPPGLLHLFTIQEFCNGFGQGRIEQLSLDSQMLIYQALNNVLLLPWRNTNDADQQWLMRSEQHARFTHALTASFLQIKETQGFLERRDLHEEAKRVITRTMHILQYLTESLEGEGTKSKQIFYQNTQESIHATLPLLKVYLNQPDISELILSFFLASFKVLRVQMGVSYTEQVIQTFLSLFTREQLTETIFQENSMGVKVVERLLKILQLIIQEPGTAFKTFLPNTINLCIEHIYPLLAERSSPDVKPSLFELLYQVLLNNWRYFFKSSILSPMVQVSQEQVENQSQFTSIMQAFGQSFLQPDIAIFRQNLQALENLNSKWKLYHKDIFKELMLSQFLNVLLQALVQKSHDLLQEEIGITIYNMAAVNFNAFYSTFLLQFLQNCNSLDDSQKSLLSHNFKVEMDLPSFTRGIHRLVNDLRYYRLCNSSLSSGPMLPTLVQGVENSMVTSES